MGLGIYFNKKAAILAFGMCLFSAIDSFAEPDPNFHIYIAYGQSNMDGNAMYSDEDTKEHPRYKMFATTNCGNWRSRGEIYPAIPPMFHCPNNQNGLSVADWFGRNLADAMPDVTVGIIPVAVPGASIKLFQPTEYQNYLSSLRSEEKWLENSAKTFDADGNVMKAILDMAKEAQKVGVIKGIIFHQGETDPGLSDWQSRVADTYNTIIKELGLNAEDVPFVAGEMVPVNTGMREKVRGLSNYITNFDYASSEGLSDRGDKLHFDAPSYRTMGERYAEAMYNLIDKTPAITEPQKPFKGTAFQIPGKIEMEDFDIPGTGNQNKSYYDTDAGNNACKDNNENKATQCSRNYREDTDVDIKTAGNGYIIGWNATGEYLEYTINVTKPGPYTLFAAVASQDGGSFKLSLIDKVSGTETDITEEIPVKGGESYDINSKTDGYPVVFEKAGEQILRFTVLQQYIDADFINFVAGENATDNELLNEASSNSTTEISSTSQNSSSSESSFSSSSAVSASSSSTIAQSSSSGILSSSSETSAGIASHIYFNGMQPTEFKVFDLQGKLLGSVNIKGTSVKNALLNAGFKLGIYVLCNKTNKMVVNTRR